MVRLPGTGVDRNTKRAGRLARRVPRENVRAQGRRGRDWNFQTGQSVADQRARPGPTQWTTMFTLALYGALPEPPPPAVAFAPLPIAAATFFGVAHWE